MTKTKDPKNNLVKPSHSTMDARTQQRGGAGLRTLAGAIAKITKPILGKRGFTNSALLADWHMVVGSLIASHSLPLRINFPSGERSEGTLIVKVSSSAFAPHIQHLEPLIIEKINGYFGWKAVKRLKLIHGPIPTSTPMKIPTTPPLPNEDDLPLEIALERLGKVVGYVRKD